MSYPGQGPNSSNSSNTAREGDVNWNPITTTLTTDPSITTATATTSTSTTATTPTTGTTTVGDLTRMLAARGAGPKTFLETLRDAALYEDTLVSDVPDANWIDVLRQAGPAGVGVLIQASGYLRQLARKKGAPEAYEGDYIVRHGEYVLKRVRVYTAAQLETALAEDCGPRAGKRLSIAVHADIHDDLEPAELGAKAVTQEWQPAQKRLLLGPGVKATNITGGYVDVYAGAKVSDVSGDAVIVVHKGGSATKIGGKAVYVLEGGTADGITRGLIYAELGAKVHDISLRRTTLGPWSEEIEEFARDTQGLNSKIFRGDDSDDSDDSDGNDESGGGGDDDGDGSDRDQSICVVQ